MADSAHSDDALGRTATQGAGEALSELAPPLGEQLGRYKLEKELGEGGMGVVHQAFDPDLERRVALKVLRTTDVNGDARQRLLREARAMARLAHPNVVTVHEVGTAHGRDYVAMELVEGQSLADWLREKPRTQREILEAFRFAARGLAAAHSAGLVHRDFKPHNVLRRADGRICVTDFGLARGVEQAEGLEMTLKLDARGAVPASRASARRMTSITETGSIVGTPAYMAPEQWAHGPVGPAADQFAYCVALWEALAGERPFKGRDIDELKRAVMAGPGKLDASVLPRRLRPVILRGLDPDPEKRWPSMDDALAALERAERRPVIAFAAGGGALLAALGIYVAVARGGAEPCAAPRLQPDRVWSDDRAAALTAAHQGYGASALASDVARWRDVRIGACLAEPSVRSAKLACLDGVLANLELQAKALAGVKGANAEVMLVDPKVCDAPRTPRLVATTSDARVEVMAAALERSVAEEALTPAAADKLVQRAGEDPCAAVIARLVAASARRTTSERRRDLDEADGAAQRCGDDRLIAEVAFQAASMAISEHELDMAAKLKRAVAAGENVMQKDLQAALDSLRAQIAQRGDHLDEAIALYDAAHDGYEARGRVREAVRTALALEQLRQVRAHPADISASAKHLAENRALAARMFGEDDPTVRMVDHSISDWQFSLGDVVGAHTRSLAIARPGTLEHKVRVTGRVVDPEGAPVAGAVVTAAGQLVADSIGLLPSPDARTAVTAADGTFVLPEAVADGNLIAISAELRSPAVKVGEHVELRLAPTSHIDGKVDLRGQPPTNVIVVAHDPIHVNDSLNVVGPVGVDGSFTLDGVPRGKLMLHVQVAHAGAQVLSGTPITVGDAAAHGITLAVATSKRVVYVIVRSTANLALTQGAVFVMPGQVAPPNVAALIQGIQDLQQREASPIEGEHAPAPVLQHAKPGDVYAVVPEAPEQLATACAIGMPPEITDPDMRQKVAQHLDRIEVRCTPIQPTDEVVTIEVPPWPRLD